MKSYKKTPKTIKGKSKMLPKYGKKTPVGLKEGAKTKIYTRIKGAEKGANKKRTQASKKVGMYGGRRTR